MPDITFTSSLYRTDEHIALWKKRLLRFAEDAKKSGFSYEVIAVANDPTELEKSVLYSLRDQPWFRLIEVPREGIYDSWNRGISEAAADTCAFWNVDDDRFADAVADGLRIIRERKSSGEAKQIVCFPFIYKRYVKVFGIPVLLKRVRMSPAPFSKEEYIRSMHAGPFFMFTKAAYEFVGPFDPVLRITADYEWCARAASKDIEFCASSIDAGSFKNDGTTSSGSKNPNHIKELLKICEKYGINDKAEEYRNKIALQSKQSK